MANFALLKSPKLISRKIWVIAKLWDFHTVTCVPFLLLSFYAIQIPWNHNSHTQCGNQAIFLPLKFYVKSILVHFKLLFWKFLRLWILIFCYFTHEMSNTFQKVQDSALIKWSKYVGVINSHKSSKIDFT